MSRTIVEDINEWAKRNDLFMGEQEIEYVTLAGDIEVLRIPMWKVSSGKAMLLQAKQFEFADIDFEGIRREDGSLNEHELEMLMAKGIKMKSEDLYSYNVELVKAVTNWDEGLIGNILENKGNDIFQKILLRALEIQRTSMLTPQEVEHEKNLESEDSTLDS